MMVQSSIDCKQNNGCVDDKGITNNYSDKQYILRIKN